MVWEPFWEAESALIRSAVQFYFDIDVRILFQLFQQQKKLKNKIWKIENFQNLKNRKIENLEHFQHQDFRFFDFSIFEILKIFRFSDFFSTFFLIDRKIFFWESWEKKSGHQCRSKISLRIEWEHSQPLKMVPKPF